MTTLPILQNTGFHRSSALHTGTSKHLLLYFKRSKTKVLNFTAVKYSLQNCTVIFLTLCSFAAKTVQSKDPRQ